MKNFVTLALMAIIIATMSCGTAFASYRDVTDSYPASQEITISESPIPASKIPNGTYSATATTSSYMCIFSNVSITVKDGSMVATFTCSKAYTRIYLGTAEEAAAQTNADGTDDSAYYKGTPADGYTPHVYSLPIDQLNTKMTIAAYAGATTTKKWYTRTVVFYSSSEITEVIANGEKKEGDSSSESDAEENSSDSDSPTDSNKGNSNSSSKTSSSSLNNKNSNVSNADSSMSKSSSNTSSSTSGSGNQGDINGTSSDPKNVLSTTSRTADASTAHMTEISLAPLRSDVDSSIAMKSGTDEESKDKTPLLVLVVVAVIALALAAFLAVSGARISKMRKQILQRKVH